MTRDHLYIAILATLTGLIVYQSAYSRGVEAGKLEAPAAASAAHVADLQRAGATYDVCIRALEHAHAEADSTRRALAEFEWPRQ